MILTKEFSPQQFADALESWTWLPISPNQPVMASLFGDVFFVGPHGWSYLDTIEGTITRLWSSVDEVQAAINTDEGQDKYLLGGLAVAAEGRGLVLGPDEGYGFRAPPILGGEFSVDNITKMDFVVSVNLAGQLLGQMKGLPPGTKVSGVTLEGEPPGGASKRRWKRHRS